MVTLLAMIRWLSCGWLPVGLGGEWGHPVDDVVGIDKLAQVLGVDLKHGLTRTQVRWDCHALSDEHERGA